MELATNLPKRLFRLRLLPLIAVGLYLAFLYGHALLKAPVTTDAGYYLSYAKQIAKGMVPYRDFPLFYMPLGMYLFSLISLLVGNASVYWPYLLLLVLVHFANAFLVYRISVKNTGSYGACILAASYLLVVYQVEGLYCALEPFVVFFGLLATFQYLHQPRQSRSHLYAGLFCGLAFLSKQYGIGIFLLMAAFYTVDLIKKDISVRNYLSFLLGCFGVLALFVVIFMLQHVMPWQLYEQMFAISYGKHSVKQWANVSFGFITAVRFLYILIISLALFIWSRRLLEKEVLFYLGAVLGFSLQFYFEDFYHYGIILVPFLILLLSCSFQVVRAGRLHFVYPLLGLLVLGVFLRENYKFLRWHLNAWKRDEQYRQAATIERLTGGKKTYFVDDPEMTFILNTPSVDMKRVGYSFIGSLSKGLLDTVLNTSQIIVVAKNHPANEMDSLQKNRHYVARQEVGNLVILENLSPEQGK